MKYLAQLLIYATLSGISKLAWYVISACAVSYGLLLGLQLFMQLGGSLT